MLRLGFLGADSFWLDEAFSVSRVAPLQTARQVWETPVDPNHPPLFFLVLWISLQLAGVSEFAARLPSALASVCDLALLFLLARRLGTSRRAALVSVLLLALSPLNVWYAQEARMYALVTTSALLFAVGLACPSWSGAVLAAGALALGLYVDFTIVPLSALLTGLWIVRWRHTDRAWLDLGRVVLVHAAAWLVFRPEWSHLAEVLGRIDTVPLLVNLRNSLGLQLTPGVPAFALMIAIAIAAALAADVAWRRLRRPHFGAATSWLAWAAVVAFTVIFVLPRAYSAKQFVATGWPFVLLAVGWLLTDGASAEPQATLARGRLLIAIGVSLAAAIVTVSTPRADWRAVVAYLNQRALRTHAVWLDPSWNAIPYEYYRPRLAPVVDGVGTARSAPAHAPAHDICLVAQRFGATPPTSPSEAWLDANLRLVEAVSFARLEVRCYAG